MPRVLKAAEVYVDQDNTVQIKANFFPAVETDAEETPVGESPADILKRAESEADFIMRRADVESGEIMEKAEKEAERIVLMAEARMEEEASKLYEENRKNGYQQGIDEATAEGERIRAEAQSVLEAAIQERDETRAAIEPDAVNLIINISEKLLGNTVRLNPAVVVALIRQGFAGVSSLTGQVTIRVSEDDYTEVLAYKEELTAAAGGLAEVEVVRDLSLGKADCVIDTPFGGIDVSLTPQFEALKENLIFLLEHPV